MNNKADMPNWNKFINDVLSGRFKEQKKKKQSNIQQIAKNRKRPGNANISQ